MLNALNQKILESLNLRIRLPDERGVFVVFRAESKQAIADSNALNDAQNSSQRSRPFAAYWYDSDDGAMYIYGRLVFDAVDIGQAMLALQRDFGIDPFAIEHIDETYILDESLRPAQSMASDDTKWLPVTRETIVALLHVDPGEITPIDPGSVAVGPGGGCSYCHFFSSNPIGESGKSVPDRAGAVDANPVDELTDVGGGLQGGDSHSDAARDESDDSNNMEDVDAVEEDRIAAEQFDDPFQSARAVIIAGCCPSCCAPHTGSCSACENGTCCDNVCCASCCGTHCCTPGQDCCNGTCCTGTCCDGYCCAAGYTCCNHECCPGECCDDVCCAFSWDGNTCCGTRCCGFLRSCCSSLDTCCGDGCCAQNEHCCGETCCALNQACCGDLCCLPNWICIGGTCCPSGATNLCNGSCCSGQCCGDGCCDKEMGEECCGNDCCQKDQCSFGLCCPLGEHGCSNTGSCCPEGLDCCANGCCPSGTYCSGGTQCCPVTQIASSGQCIPPTDCDGCANQGILSGGTITISPNPAVVCIGQQMTFTISGVIDSGGVKKVNCSSVSIPPVAPTYTWMIVKPNNDAVFGTGAIASIYASLPGTYSCSFTARAYRDCEPVPHSVGPVTAQSPTITSVEWVTYPGNVALDGCPNNGGQRIFPDKLTSGDSNPSSRPLVYLDAHTSPAKLGCTVYFKIWDVDDPFDQNNATMPDVALIDNNTSGPDNRGTAGGPMSGYPPTDASGKAEMTFVVSMQPGDNFRAGASMVSNAINQTTTQTQADSNSPPEYVKLGEMLTVWRKLHVETDSMAAVTGNTLSTTFTDIAGSGTALTEIRGLTGLDDGSLNFDSSPPSNGRFENGKLVIGSGTGATTISPVSGNGVTRVMFNTASIAGLQFSAAAGTGGGTMSGTITQLQRLSSSQYVWTLAITNHSQNPIDWFDFTGGTMSVGGGIALPIIGASAPAVQLTTSSLSIPCTVHDDDDDTLLPQLPDTSTMTTALQRAYILPVFDVGDNNMGVSFRLNVNKQSSDIAEAIDWDSAALNAPDFWVAYVLEAFQSQASNSDHDPVTEGSVLGISSLSAGGSITFIEVIQSHEGVSDPVARQQNNVVHEIGHVVGQAADEPVTDLNSNYTANYLSHIRSTPRPSP